MIPIIYLIIASCNADHQALLQRGILIARARQSTIIVEGQQEIELKYKWQIPAAGQNFTNLNSTCAGINKTQSELNTEIEQFFRKNFRILFAKNSTSQEKERGKRSTTPTTIMTRTTPEVNMTPTPSTTREVASTANLNLLQDYPHYKTLMEDVSKSAYNRNTTEYDVNYIGRSPYKLGLSTTMPYDMQKFILQGNPLNGSFACNTTSNSEGTINIFSQGNNKFPTY